MTFASTFAFGLALLALAMVGLDALGAPGWLVVLPWLVPTVAVLGWSLVRPRAADRHDDDHGWVDYVSTRVLVGEERLRPTPQRVLTAVVAGGPIGWVFLLGLVAELAGVV